MKEWQVMAIMKLGSTGRSFLLTAAISSQWPLYHKYDLVTSRLRLILPEVGEEAAGVVAEQVVCDTHARGSAERRRLRFVEGPVPVR
jgi:hypothetical protein